MKSRYCNKAHALLFSLTLLLSANSFALDLQKHQDVRAYIQDLVTHYHFNQQQLTHWFEQTEFMPDIIQKMNTPYEAKPWYIYRKTIITPQRIQQGVQFWRANASSLQQAEQTYGVPATVIMGIIGIETGYGANTGKYPLIDSLSTLAFNYPRRAKFFRHELTEFLLLSREQKWNPLAIKGSYAGAMGLPQFMPSNYRKYGIDADKDGNKNLLTDNKDVILSVANYLEKMGWQRQQVISIPLQSNRIAKRFFDGSGKLRYTVHQLRDYGVHLTYAPTLKVGVLNLKDQHGIEQWITFPNFMAIKRYNSSSNYAMAVYQLGLAVNAARKVSH